MGNDAAELHAIFYFLLRAIECLVLRHNSCWMDATSLFAYICLHNLHIALFPPLLAYKRHSKKPFIHLSKKSVKLINFSLHEIIKLESATFHTHERESFN